jgi:aspartate 1-decarboxylase
MYRTMMKSKIHRATVTQADLHYVGSLTISADLMEAADLLPGEKVDIVDINNGSRLSTYVIEGPRDSGIIGINGAAARLISPGDLVIIIAYAHVSDDEARDVKPHVVFVDDQNHVQTTGHDPADAPESTGLLRGDLPATAHSSAPAPRHRGRPTG